VHYENINAKMSVLVSDQIKIQRKFKITMEMEGQVHCIVV